MRYVRSRRVVPRSLLACLLAAGTCAAHAQSIEPRAYSNAPIGVNFLITGYAYTSGGLASDTSLPVTNAQLNTSNAVFAYIRTLDLWGMCGKFDATVPYSWLSGTADFAGEPVTRVVNGLGDPAFRFSIDLYGAPALSLKQFANYRQDLIVGASVEVSAPLGQYDTSKVVNLGTNRWSFKPEIGASKAVGRWTLEAQAAATLFTDNKDFFGGNVRAQKPIYSMQGHVIYGFDSGIWIAFDATYFTGGRTTVNGTLNNDLEQNWRLGGTLALPVSTRNSIKLNASSGVSTRTGNNYDQIGIAWQYRWGGGI